MADAAARLSFVDGPYSVEGPLGRAAAAALGAMSGELEIWFWEELRRLSDARRDWRASPDFDRALALRVCAHDLKGLGATYGSPLAGRIAGSLERLMLDGAPHVGLIEAHVDAVLAVVRADARRPDDPAGLQLVEALESAVTARCR